MTRREPLLLHASSRVGFFAGLLDVSPSRHSHVSDANHLMCTSLEQSETGALPQLGVPLPLPPGVSLPRWLQGPFPSQDALAGTDSRGKALMAVQNGVNQRLNGVNQR